MVAPNLVDDRQRVSGATFTADLSPKMIDRAKGSAAETVEVIIPPSGAIYFGPEAIRMDIRRPVSASDIGAPIVIDPVGPEDFRYGFLQEEYQGQANRPSVRNIDQYLAPAKAIGQLEIEALSENLNLDISVNMGRAMFDAQGLPFPDDSGIMFFGDAWNMLGTYSDTYMPLGFGNLREFPQRWGHYSDSIILAPQPVERLYTPGANIAPDVDVVQALRNSRFREVAERLDYLNAELAEEPDWDVDEVDPDSVLDFATFLLTANPSALPIVGLHPSGFVFAQWRLVPHEGDELWGCRDGSLVMVFGPSQLVNFAASAGMVEGADSVITANGVMHVRDLGGSLGYFLSRIAEFELDED